MSLLERGSVRFDTEECNVTLLALGMETGAEGESAALEKWERHENRVSPGKFQGSTLILAKGN